MPRRAFERDVVGADGQGVGGVIEVGGSTQESEAVACHEQRQPPALRPDEAGGCAQRAALRSIGLERL
jgi:hypothetical protein